MAPTTSDPADAIDGTLNTDIMVAYTETPYPSLIAWNIPKLAGLRDQIPPHAYTNSIALLSSWADITDLKSEYQVLTHANSEQSCVRSYTMR